MNPAVDRFRQMETSRIARLAHEAAKKALARFMPRATPARAAATLNLPRPVATAPPLPAPPPPVRYRRAPKTCTECGATGHRRNSPAFHPKDGAGPTDGPAGSAAPAPPAPPADDQHASAEHSAPPVPPEATTDDLEPTPAVARLREHRGPFRRSTIPATKLSREEKRAASLVVLDDADRPQTRGDCASMPRPCPFVSCSHHLYLDVNEETGAIKLNHPDKEPWELADSCALDLADAGPLTLEEVGARIGVTRERIRQVEERTFRKLRKVATGMADAFGAAPDIASVEDRLGWR